ncbi:hypothetical protein ACIQ4I_18690 [Rummeliibacillus sp. NPDC094406]|uniref:hypothetical protein n=1 Tax=Rummeliibacillus sp. NPDC094406 TaxID=3364511 RepID=UPI0037FAE212
MKKAVIRRVKKIVNIEKNLAKSLAYSSNSMYNIKCWSLTAMKREVAGTPGRIAMARVWEISVENV